VIAKATQLGGSSLTKEVFFQGTSRWWTELTLRRLAESAETEIRVPDLRDAWTWLGVSANN
jgi:hypothetical protein